jgi:hypothetical protein
MCGRSNPSVSRAGLGREGQGPGRAFEGDSVLRPSVSLLVLVLACATQPQAPAPGRSTATGSFRLVPREGVTPGGSSGSPYADRSLRDVEFVDYAHPGFAVVYLDGRRAPGGYGELAIRASKLRTRLEPSELAVGAGGTLRVRNETEAPHVLSFPSAGRVQKLLPGEALELPLASPGAQALFLLDVPGSEATVFAAPGPFAVVASDGHWEIRDVEPGRVRLIAWHARFPPTSHWLDLAADGVAQVDLEVGVGQRTEASDEPD